MPETPTFGRYAEIPYDQMTPEQQEGYRSLIETPRRGSRAEQDLGPQPEAGEGRGPFGAHFHAGRYSLSEREREIAVVHHHQQIAFGLPDQRARAARQGSRTAGRQGRGDARGPADVVRRRARAGRLRDGDCLANARWVSQGLYDRAVKALGHVGITDVITLMGHYSSVAMTLAFYDVPAGATGMAQVMEAAPRPPMGPTGPRSTQAAQSSYTLPTLRKERQHATITGNQIHRRSPDLHRQAPTVGWQRRGSRRTRVYPST